MSYIFLIFFDFSPQKKHVSHRHLSGHLHKKKLKNLSSPTAMSCFFSASGAAGVEVAAAWLNVGKQTTCWWWRRAARCFVVVSCFLVGGEEKKHGRKSIQWSSCCCQVEVNISTNWIFVISYQVAKELMVYKKNHQTKTPQYLNITAIFSEKSSSNLFFEGQNQSNRWHVSHHPNSSVSAPQSSVLRDPFDPRPSPTVDWMLTFHKKRGRRRRAWQKQTPRRPATLIYVYIYINHIIIIIYLKLKAI